MPSLPKSIPNKKAIETPKTGFRKKHESVNSKFYHSKEWYELRNWFIRQNPLCKWCEEEGIVKEANVVDHVKEILDGGEMLDQNNLMSLCNKHHMQKTNFARVKRKRKGGHI